VCQTTSPTIFEYAFEDLSNDLSQKKNIWMRFCSYLRCSWNIERTTDLISLTLHISSHSAPKHHQPLFWYNLSLFQIRLVQFKKTYTNHFRPGFFDVTQDFCEILGKGVQSTAFFRSIFTNIFPGVFETMEKNFRPCPFKVGIGWR
jgi:hypothetical protein